MGAKRVSKQGVTVSTGNAIEVTNTTGSVLFSVDSTGSLNTLPNLTAKGSILTASAANTPADLAVGNLGETLVADSSTSTGLAYSPMGLTQPIINGAFDIAQRGTTTTTLSTTYLLDRWAASVNAGATGTQERVAGLTVGTQVFQYAWKFTASSNFTFMQMGQQIEFSNCYLLQNQQVTISFYAQANNSNAASTTLTVRTRTAAGVDASCLFTGTAVGTNQTITTTPTRYSITRTLPATFGALSLEFVLGTAGASGDGFTITGIQIDRGSVALPFRRAGGTIAGEFQACQRYYERFDSSSDGWLFLYAGYANSTTSARGTIPLQVTKRVSPTVTVTNATSLVARDGSVNATATAFSIGRPQKMLLGEATLTTTGLTLGRGLMVDTSGNTNFVLEASAEL